MSVMDLFERLVKGATGKAGNASRGVLMQLVRQVALALETVLVCELRIPAPPRSYGHATFVKRANRSIEERERQICERIVATQRVFSDVRVLSCSTDAIRAGVKRQNMMFCTDRGVAAWGLPQVERTLWKGNYINIFFRLY